MTPFVVLDHEQAWNLTKFLIRGPKAMDEKELRKLLATFVDMQMQMLYGIPAWANDYLNSCREKSEVRWGVKKK